MRCITNKDGMTNSAVLSLCQDSVGFLWIGTCDGVNVYDGVAVHSLSDIFPQSPLSGNIVEGIMESPGGIMWIRTNHGINRLDRQRGEILVYPQFQGREILRKNSRGEVFVVGENRRIYNFDDSEKEFKEIDDISIDRDTIYEIAFVADKLLVFSHGGIYSKGLELRRQGYFGGSTTTLSTSPLIFARQRGRDVITIDSGCMARRFNVSTYSNDSLLSLKNLISQKGVVSDMSFDRDSNLFISFETSGVVKADKSHDYRIHDLGITAGVFCLSASERQNVVWIGSDCQGLFTYYTGQYDITTLPFSHFNDIVSHPVRSLIIDRDNTLWMATKGDGLLEVNDFDHHTGSYGSMRLHTSANSPLRHNMVFALASSRRHPWMWIGSEEGLNYYDYTTRRVMAIDPGVRLRWVHGLYEQADSILWIASIGQGVWIAVIDSAGGTPRVKSIKQYTVDDGNFSSNYFFSLSVDDKGEPVFSNRGLGAVVFDSDNDSLRIVKLDGDYDTQTVNDVFTTIKEGDSYWLGTGHGLLNKTPDGERLYYGRDKGFANSTIHAILKSNDGNIWVSTNRGLVCFDPATERGNLFDKDFGVTVTEFSDGAACTDRDGCLMFGGIDGITLVAPDKNYVAVDDYIPTPRLIGLLVDGKNVGLGDRFDRDRNTLTLSHDQQYFTLLFATSDFINAYNSSYYYSLDGKEWVMNGRDNSWSFTGMPPGDYKLYVKYVDLQTGFEGKPMMVNMRITPPWYLSTIAKALYLLLGLIIIGAAVYYLLRRQKRRQQRAFADIKAAHKEEVYEEKLKFFTNITHEFCTPLTLIYGPCERILSYEGADGYVRKYVGLIRSNTQRLNNLIQEIIDFRRIETGNNRRKVRRIDVSDLCNDIIQSFSDLAERNNVNVINEVAPDIIWNTDYRSISKIVTNLVSNAFKYTAPGGTVKVGLAMKDSHLLLTVWNTGKGISEEDKKRVFNHYAILDNVEEKATKGLTARNGLGMAICHSMVDILEGNIEIDSKVGEYACFIVTLPELELDTEEAVDSREMESPTIPAPDQIVGYGIGADGVSAPVSSVPYPKAGSKDAVKILIVDDNEDMLTLLADSLSEYKIIKATNGKDAIKELVDSMPDLVITDIMMPGTDGLELTRQIKSNRHTMHVPLIILSAKNSNEEIVAGIETGADVYISKPFSFSYLRAVIKRLLEHNSKLKEYYTTSASAYEYSNGKLLDQESKDFMNKITAFIDDNIDNPDLSPEMIAHHMRFSNRNLYRKFKEMGLASPNDFIKEHRLDFAARLLCTTNLTIQEIIYRSGFSNRSHFYKEFFKRFESTPKEYRNAHRLKDDSLTGNG
ncbi:hybrid sensor histidine kinase/response regulator transcription factor [uncultured Muribaculum sp.]|uniref:hybrid sensor histidine kinase/response regulator transcription factor n=1 Tax=uncultured Muribaculum sp. TaxID=1918613 RepID=UPI0025E1A753|nr:hybrid sensor histidine kinase/response regulator transcription factor [uncultured Muribaculum sp.]